MSHQISTAQQNDVDVPSLSAAFPNSFGQNSDLRIEHLAGDLSSRNYYRLLNKKTLNSFILQQGETFDDANTAKHPFLSAQRLFKSVGVPVPTIVATHGKKGWILQNDLGNTMLQQDLRTEFYSQSLCYLAKIHCGAFKFQNSQPHFGQFFDIEKLQAEMAHTEKFLIQTYYKMPGKKDFLDLTKDFNTYLANRPRFLAHRDYHSRNLMIQNGQVFVIDFQDARMGPLSYDLVSLIWDPYVHLDEPFKKQCVRTFFEQIEIAQKQFYHPQLNILKNEHFIQEVKDIEIPRMKVQRLLKACGSYAAFFVTRGRKDFLHCIRPTLLEVQGTLEKICASDIAFASEEKLLALLGSILSDPEPIM